MLSFEVNDAQSATSHRITATDHRRHEFGGVESTIDRKRDGRGGEPAGGLLRLSVGLEHPTISGPISTKRLRASSHIRSQRKKSTTLHMGASWTQRFRFD